jgi:YVTN family beta-propeller protein
MYKIRCFAILLFCSMIMFSNAQTGSLLVANKADNTLSIFDIATKELRALIPVGEGPHELAVSPDGKTAAVCNYGASKPGNSLSIIDVPGKQNIKTIDLGQYTRPHGIEFISPTEVIVTSEATKNLIKVNVVTGAVSLIAFTGQEASHMVAWTPATAGNAYVANIRSGTASVISIGDQKVLRHVPLSQGIEGIAVSPDGKELWVANRDQGNVTALNTATWEPIAVLAADKVAYRVRFLANGKYALVSNGSAGNVNVYDVQKKTMIKTIDFTTLAANSRSGKTDQPVPGGITSATDSKYVFVASTGYNLAVMIDTQNWNIAGFFPTGNVPDGIYYSPVQIAR